jgi:uncharacterized protein (TIGR00661 family)
MRIIYGICSWGLGHATRSLPVLRKFIQEDNEVTIISHGRSLELLRRELGSDLTYVDIPDYPILLSTSPRQFMAKSMIYWPLFVRKLQQGHHQLKRMLLNKNYDLILSDARYDIYSLTNPSFFISHQMRIMNPLRLRMLEHGSELFNSYFLKRFKGFIIPDYKEDDLSGDLSHHLKRIKKDKLHYVGVLSDFNKKRVKKDIDYLISITGPEPQRSMLEHNLLSQMDQLKGTIAVTLGKTEQQKETTKGNVRIFSYLSKEERETMLNRAKLVISRSGYSTILDLAVIGTKALMTPTPGQIEQEYLARYHHKKHTFYAVDQDHIDLSRDVEKAKHTTGITRKCDVKKSVENIMTIVTS